MDEPAISPHAYGLEGPFPTPPRRLHRSSLIACLDSWLKGFSSGWSQTDRSPEGYHLALSLLMEKNQRPHPVEAQCAIAARVDHPNYDFASGLFLSACYNLSSESVIVHRIIGDSSMAQSPPKKTYKETMVGYNLRRSKTLIIPDGVDVRWVGNTSNGLIVVVGRVEGGFEKTRGVVIGTGNIEWLVELSGAYISTCSLNFTDRAHEAFLVSLSIEGEQHETLWSPWTFEKSRRSVYPKLFTYAESVCNSFSPKKSIEDHVKAASSLTADSIMASLYKAKEEDEGF